MNCGTCSRWSLVGEMGRHGFGQCGARPEPYRSAITTPAQCQCRVGKYLKAPASVLRERENAEGRLL